MTTPSDHGLKAWSFDPAFVAAGAALADGVASLVGVRFRFGAHVTRLHAVVTTAGATIANCFAGLYDDDGQRLAVTADQATAWASTGHKAMALAAPVDVGPGWYYVALLEGSGTTDVQLGRGPAGGSVAHNVGMAAPQLRQAASGSGQTALPASIATGGLDPTTGVNFWVGVS